MFCGRPNRWNCKHSGRCDVSEQGAARRADANEPGYCGAEGRGCLPQAKARFAVVLSCLHREIAILIGEVVDGGNLVIEIVQPTFTEYLRKSSVFGDRDAALRDPRVCAPAPIGRLISRSMTAIDPLSAIDPAFRDVDVH